MSISKDPEKRKKQLANLKPKAAYTKEEAKKYGSKGGKKTQKKKKAVKLFKEIAEDLFSMAAPEEVKKQIKKFFPEVDEETLNAKAAMLFKVYSKALSGDLNAFQLMRDTIGEKPVEKTETVNKNTNVNTTLDEAKKMADDLNELLDRED